MATRRELCLEEKINLIKEKENGPDAWNSNFCTWNFSIVYGLNKLYEWKSIDQ
jgi:hypothetical protein